MCTALCASMVETRDEPIEIARGLRRRDPDLLAFLLDRYQHRLFRYLLYLTGDKALAEDLFQETWLRVLERGRQYDGRSPFVPWLLGIARHLAIDQLRRRTPGSLEDAEADASAPALADERPSAFEQVASQEGQEGLSQLMARLPAIHREVLSLRFLEGLALAEIARLTGVPVPTVKSRLYRALESARRLWGERR